MKTILLVDDNETDQFLHEVVVEKFDPSIRILKAYDGHEALEKITAFDGKIDVIFLDINMPGMNGFEFLGEYNKRPSPSSVVVMLSSSKQESDKEKALAYDFVKEYVAKPLAIQNLENLSQNLVKD